MSKESVKALSEALVNFRKAITNDLSSDEKDDYENLANITDKIIKTYNAGDIPKLKQGLGGFSRKASDSYSKWPPEFKELCGCIEHLKQELF